MKAMKAMLVKRSSKNQISLPIALLKRAGLGPEDVYFRIDYEERNGVIVLKPVEIEDKISPEEFRRFEDWATRSKPGDKKFKSMDEAIRHLRQKS